MFASTPEIPSWVQFPKRDFHENMMVQFTEGMPALVQGDDRVQFDTSTPDYVDQLTEFYENYLGIIEASDVTALEQFSLSEQYAPGFHEFIAQLELLPAPPLMLKGQVTGPFTLGTNLLDQDRRCSYYDEQLHDVVVKTVAMKALWQLTSLGAFELPMMIFLDEPALLGYGSQTFITISREDVVQDINEVVAVIHGQSALAGVHCEANTDWSLLMETELDILNFDAYDHMDSIALYPAELDLFLARGGILAWGLVPTLDKAAAASETAPSLLSRFEAGVDLLVGKGLDREALLCKALITPSCGVGGVLDEPLAARVLSLLQQLSLTLRQQHGYVDLS